ncbi:MAG: putative sugar kinase [Candidatus Bathyarchaeota archaeon BA1]|nr:MAG: putative sugar kinase [Candidatus Bathyarchaeota archaeon BA1]
MKVSVISVGDANVDLIAPIKTLPDKGEEVLIDKISKFPGGSAANLSVALARLGVSSGLIGRIGKDSFGQFLIEQLRKENVDISQLQVDERVGTALLFIVVTKNGDRTMYTFRGANVHLSSKQVNMDYVRNADILHISGYTLISNPQRKTTLKILNVAKKAGVFVSFDVGVLAPIEAANYIRSILRSIDLLFLNEIEAVSLMRIKNPEASAESILDLGPGIVALKLRERGCCVLTKEEKLHSPAFEVDVVDTTGAGDAFDAGFLFGIKEGWGLKKTALFANAVGALSVTKFGAWSALPTRREAEGFIRERGAEI